jgi:hypothetical protein
MTQWIIRAHIKRTSDVLVEADTPEEAKAKFEAFDWVDEFPGETLDWHATRAPELDE